MEKLNIAELLRDCPKGMELDCTMFDRLEFDRIDDKYSHDFIIVCRVKIEYGQYNFHTFTKYGCYSRDSYSKCVIFPKGKTTWEGFHRPFKDGDVVVSEKGDIHLLRTSDSSYCAFREEWKDKFDRSVTTGVHVARFATKEEKEILFNTIKANGYKWNAETKTLEKLIEQKFKVGDRIRSKINQIVYTIEDIRDDVYIIQADVCSFCYHIPFDKEIYYELVPNKFDITTFKPFDKVLVRDTNGHCWRATFYSHRTDTYSYTTTGLYAQCIPYEGNEHLLGTTNDCDEYYKTWE